MCAKFNNNYRKGFAGSNLIKNLNPGLQEKDCKNNIFRNP
jgi:hypothetical protein